MSCSNGASGPSLLATCGGEQTKFRKYLLEKGEKGPVNAPGDKL
jgi:hypothetical protein